MLGHDYRDGDGLRPACGFLAAPPGITPSAWGRSFVLGCGWTPYPTIGLAAQGLRGPLKIDAMCSAAEETLVESPVSRASCT